MTTALLIKLAPLIAAQQGSQASNFFAALNQPQPADAATGTVIAVPVSTTGVTVAAAPAAAPTATKEIVVAGKVDNSPGKVDVTTEETDDSSSGGSAPWIKILIAIIIIIVLIFIGYIIYTMSKKNQVAAIRAPMFNNMNANAPIPTPDNSSADEYIPDWAYTGQFYVSTNYNDESILDLPLSNSFIDTINDMAILNVYLVDGGHLNNFTIPSSMRIPNAVNASISFINARSDDSSGNFVNVNDPAGVPIANRAAYSLICPHTDCMGDPRENQSPFMDSLADTNNQRYTLFLGDWYKAIGCSLKNGEHNTDSNVVTTSLTLAPGRISQLRTCRNSSQSVFNRRTGVYSNLETWAPAGSMSSIPAWFINEQPLSPGVVW